MFAKTDQRAPLKPVEFLILAVLFDGPLHGYGIVQGIEERTRGRVRLRPGDVYRVISRLANRQLLEHHERRAVEPGARRRTYYAITAAGSQAARAEAVMLSAVSASMISKTSGSG